MSIILQALKKAEAARDIGQVPTLQAHASVLAQDDDAQGPVGRRWQIGAGLLLLALAAAAVVLFSRNQDTAHSNTPAPSATAPTVSPVPVAVTVVVPLVREPVAAAPASVPALPTSAVQASSAVASPALAAKPLALAAPAQSSSAVPALEELSPEQRKGLPNISIGGSIYAERAADRMLIVNGQVQHEGDVIAPDLTLISIGPKAAVLRWGQVRFTVRY
jgi:general secretion pathway protein B